MELNDNNSGPLGCGGSSNGRALDCDSSGCRFESDPSPFAGIGRAW